MVAIVPITTTLRVPNLPIGPIVDKDGKPTQNEMIFRQALIDLLQTYLGQEGAVAPDQSAANVQTILNGQDISGNYTMLPGTMIYRTDATVPAMPGDPTYPADKLIVAFRNPATALPYVPGSQPVLYYVNVTAL